MLQSQLRILPNLTTKLWIPTYAQKNTDKKFQQPTALFAAFRRELTLDQCDTLACLLNMYDAISREEAQEALRVGMLIGQDSLKK